MRLEEIYNKRAADFATLSRSLQKRYDRFAMVRLLIFFVAIGLSILAYSVYPWSLLIVIPLFISAFGWFVFWHQKIIGEKLHNEALSNLNLDESEACRYKFGKFEDGKEFLNPLNPYTYDLDFFGPNSLFQSLNRTSTAIGKVRLAKILAGPSIPEIITARQKGIQELSAKLDWRQNFQATGMRTSDQLKDVDNLNAWMQDEDLVRGNAKYKAALIWVPVLLLLVIITPLAWLPLSAKAFFLLVPVYFLKQSLEKVNKIHEKTGKAEKVLRHYTRLIRHIETEKFDPGILKQLQSEFNVNGIVASESLHKLSGILGQLNVRYNAFAIVLNLLLLWDLRFVLKLEKWKRDHQQKLLSWFDSLQEFDALVSLGNLRYNHPDWCFPIFSKDDEPVFDGTSIGHPLIPIEKRVCNDLKFPFRGHLKLITGSNMAGKSTFLRSAGLSVAMAMSGLPVCAGSLKLKPLEVYSSMRTTDDLHENTSSFYAELKRLKFILEAVKSEKPIFFLLDEILKGTNSKDRHTGSEALIRQLIAQNGNGLVATHDLELGYLSNEFPDNLENLCFEVSVDGEELYFDYKVRKGLPKSLNATLLMRKMGIEI